MGRDPTHQEATGRALAGDYRGAAVAMPGPQTWFFIPQSSDDSQQADLDTLARSRLRAFAPPRVGPAGRERCWLMRRGLAFLVAHSIPSPTEDPEGRAIADLLFVVASTWRAPNQAMSNSQDLWMACSGDLLITS
ncbi:hypothetical protein GCM10028781_34200 [Nostocoides australiense]